MKRVGSTLRPFDLSSILKTHKISLAASSPISADNFRTFSPSWTFSESRSFNRWFLSSNKFSNCLILKIYYLNDNQKPQYL